MSELDLLELHKKRKHNVHANCWSTWFHYADGKKVCPVCWKPVKKLTGFFDRLEQCVKQNCYQCGWDILKKQHIVRGSSEHFFRHRYSFGIELYQVQNCICHWATEGNIDMVRLMIEFMRQEEIQLDDDQTVLDAMYSGHMDIADYLLNQMNPNHDMSDLFECAATYNEPDVMEYLSGRFMEQFDENIDASINAAVEDLAVKTYIYLAEYKGLSHEEITGKAWELVDKMNKNDQKKASKYLEDKGIKRTK
jgi:hypothetical protein